MVRRAIACSPPSREPVPVRRQPMFLGWRSKPAEYTAAAAARVGEPRPSGGRPVEHLDLEIVGIPGSLFVHLHSDLPLRAGRVVDAVVISPPVWLSRRPFFWCASIFQGWLGLNQDSLSVQFTVTQQADCYRDIGQSLHLYETKTSAKTRRFVADRKRTDHSARFARSARGVRGSLRSWQDCQH